MFIVALLTIAKIWRQFCLSADEWIEKVWYIDTVEYYSAIKNETLPFVNTWMDLKGIMLSGISQRKTNTLSSHLYVDSKRTPRQTSGQDGGVGRHASFPHATRELQLNLKTNNTQNCQKIELYGSPTTKYLKKPHSSRRAER